MDTLTQLKQIWLSAQLDVFEGNQNYLKHQTIAGKDAISHLKKSNFKNKEFASSDLYSFYQD